MNSSDEVRCPKCNSNQLTANKKGFGDKKAVAGALLTGGIGLLADTTGSNKIIITCLNCGNQFKPGQKAVSSAGQPRVIWDEQLKKHVINPNAKTTASAPLWAVLVIVIIALIFLVIK